MKFACPSCGTRYSIANDKVPAGASVKCKCKVCGIAIRLNPRTKAPRPEPTAVEPPKQGRTEAAPLNGPRDLGATTVVSLGKLNELRRHAASDTRTDEGWYVVINGVQQGPMTTDALQRLVDNQTIGVNSLVWKDGMIGWRHIEEVDELREFFSSASNPTRPPWGTTPERFDEAPAPIGETSTGIPGTTSNDVNETEGETKCQESSPSEDTRAFMATAGLLKRRRTHAAFAVMGFAAVLAGAGTIAFNMMETYTARDMGLSDKPNRIEDLETKRLFERVREEIAEETDPERREALQRELLGVRVHPSETASRRHSSRKATDDNPMADGIQETRKLSKSERSMVEDLFQDESKETTSPEPETFARVQASDLPDGLTREAISRVISDKQSSMKLCVTEAFRQGEKLNGRMDVKITIEATGEVSNASIDTEKYKNSSIGQCTIRRVSSWKFPRFNGERVTVEFPYLLTLNL